MRGRPNDLNVQLGSFREIYGLTHALRIPLATPTSSRQLDRLLQRLRSHPSASAVPSVVFRPVNTHCLVIGSLSLKTKDRMEQALSLLKGLDMNAIFHKVTQSETSSNEYSLSAAPQSYKPSKNFMVSLAGIVRNDALHKCHRLYIPITDHGGGLQAFVQEIRSIFRSAGLMSTLRIERTGSVPMHFKVLGNTNVKSTAVKTKPSVRQKLRENQVLNV